MTRLFLGWIFCNRERERERERFGSEWMGWRGIGGVIKGYEQKSESSFLFSSVFFKKSGG
jgi:hypothetical protein